MDPGRRWPEDKAEKENAVKEWSEWAVKARLGELERDGNRYADIRSNNPPVIGCGVS